MICGHAQPTLLTEAWIGIRGSEGLHSEPSGMEFPSGIQAVRNLLDVALACIDPVRVDHAGLVGRPHTHERHQNLRHFGAFTLAHSF